MPSASARSPCRRGRCRARRRWDREEAPGRRGRRRHRRRADGPRRTRPATRSAGHDPGGGGCWRPRTCPRRGSAGRPRGRSARWRDSHALRPESSRPPAFEMRSRWRDPIRATSRRSWRSGTARRPPRSSRRRSGSHRHRESGLRPPVLSQPVHADGPHAVTARRLGVCGAGGREIRRRGPARRSADTVLRLPRGTRARIGKLLHAVPGGRRPVREGGLGRPHPGGRSVEVLEQQPAHRRGRLGEVLDHRVDG